MFKQKQCTTCYGKGIVRNKQTNRFERCHCGRLLDSVGSAKLAKQAILDKRFKEVKEKGW